MRVLVTGGLGVNGSWVTRNLLNEGHEPIVFEARADYSLAPDIEGQFPLVLGDVADLDALVAACQNYRVERIVHLAALMPNDSQDRLRQGFIINALGAVNVFEAARQCDVQRVVFTSSKSAYGRVPDTPYGPPEYTPIAETATCDPVIAYDIEKFAAEVMARNYQQNYGMEIVSLRFGTIYAPGKLARHGRMGLLAVMIENALAGVETSIPSGGDQVDDVMYVGDVARGITLSLFAAPELEPMYNIATGYGTTPRQFAEAVRAVIPDAEINVGPGMDYLGMGINYYSISDISLAKRDLGYEPAYGLREGIEDYVATVRSLGLGAE